MFVADRFSTWPLIALEMSTVAAALKGEVLQHVKHVFYCYIRDGFSVSAANLLVGAAL